jgi:hypothetical protein
MEGSESVKILMNPDPDRGGPKTYGSESISTTLIKKLTSVYLLKESLQGYVRLQEKLPGAREQVPFLAVLADFILLKGPRQSRGIFRFTFTFSSIIF